MPTNRILRLAAVLLLIGSASAAMAQQPLTYTDLVGRMTDLSRLAVLPVPGEKCAQCSSYDRASRYDEKTGKYVRWDANGDGGGIIRAENGHVVMAEMEGPGCIWRIWSAKAQKGHVKIFLDGSDTPVTDMPFIDYFDGKHAPFNYPGLSYDMETTKSHGQNLYFPIPYQKSCKIIAEKGWGNYYHFVYDTFPKGTTVPTFSAALAAQNAESLRRIDSFFRDRLGDDPAGDRPGRETVSKTATAAPGQAVRVAELTGPRAITAIRVRTKLGDREDEMAALRKMVLRITWDGQKNPAVWCPLGDFFGTAPGMNLYKSLPTGMTKDGFYAYWYMPFAASAVVELVNDDSAPRSVAFEIVHAPLGRPFEGLGHFHAKWHRDTVELPLDRWPDWTMLLTQGRGRFCGVMLHVWNPRGGWWGEGDEKFFVDGEKFPSTIGTGSEDYFGYAWGDPNIFLKPYHAQTMTQGNTGHQSLLRWHIVDNVPFTKSFEGCIEKYFRNRDMGTLFACVPIWYLSPDGVDGYAALPVDQRHGYYVKPAPVAGGLKLAGNPPGMVQIQGMGGFGPKKWPRNEQLWWTGAKPGAKMDLTATVTKAGKYDVSIVLTKARDYAIVQLCLDGKKVAGPIDLYNPAVVPSEPVALGTHELAAGEHTITVEILGANEKALKAYMVGVSHLILKPGK